MGKQEKSILVLALIAAFVAMALYVPGVIVAGDMEPSAAPGPTMHTLDEIYNLLCPECPQFTVTEAGVPKTGETKCYRTDYYEPISCTGTGQDGEYQKGVAWPNPRFTVPGDGTVIDNLTGLVWLKNADCFGARSWAAALDDSNNLASGSCGLTDGSQAGDWRLPNANELLSLIKYGDVYWPALPDTAGTGQWSEGDPFTNIAFGDYWSSSSRSSGTHAWALHMYRGEYNGSGKSNSYRVWPVRDPGSKAHAGHLEPPGPPGSTMHTLDEIYFALSTEVCPECQPSITIEAGVPRTGQTTKFADGDDGDLQKGVAWPNPRFTISDGTVIDNLTGLVWMREARCWWDKYGADRPIWADALNYCNTLASGDCLLTDGSVAGDWRMPNVKELLSLIKYDDELSQGVDPQRPYDWHLDALPDTAGTGHWTDHWVVEEGNPFFRIGFWHYWTSTTLNLSNWGGVAYDVYLFRGVVNYGDKDNDQHIGDGVLCVRDP